MSDDTGTIYTKDEQIALLTEDNERLRRLAASAIALAEAADEEGAYLADLASDKGWLATERALVALYAATQAE